MKCLHILPMNKLSGAEKLALILCKNLERYEPIVVCGGDNLKSIFEANAIKSYAVDFKNNSVIKSAKELSKIAKENNIKIVHAHDNNASVVAYIAKILYRNKFKIISHMHSCYPWLKINGKNKIIDSILRNKYDYNIACGNLVYDFCLDNAKYIDKNKLSVLSNAIDLQEIKVAENKKIDLYENYNIPRNKIIIGYVGRLIELKGLIPFIEEFNKRKEEFTDSMVLLVGSGNQENEIKHLIHELGLDNQFILAGQQENVYDFYPLMDIFFLPSTYEGLPMVILEAMSFEVPIVSMDVGSIKELINNKYNGVLVQQGEYSKFIQKIKELKNDNYIRNLFGERSLKHIKENYDIKQYIDNIEKIYDKLA